MNLLSWMLTVAVTAVLYWGGFPFLYIIAGALCTMILVSLLTYKSTKTTVKPGHQIVVSSVPQGRNVGSEPSPFGIIGVKDND